MINAGIKLASHITWKKFATLVVMFLCTAGTVFGQMSTNVSFTVNQTIPLGDPSGLASTENLNFSSIPNFSSIVNLTVTLNISGGFTGDYYAYLANNQGGFVVLLNRSGTTSSNPLGYTDSGYNITLATGSPNIHTYQTSVNPGGGVLTGTWAPDGRNTDPSTVVDTYPVNTSLTSFIGNNPSGQWTLFLADLDYGEQGTLVSWGMTLTVVPEPSSVGLALLGLGLCFGLRHWARRRA